MTIVLLRDYATAEAPYCNGFVHSRVKAYIKSGLDTKVFVLNPEARPSTYYYEDVEVIVGNKHDFCTLASEYDKITVCVHFLDSYIIECLQLTSNINKAIVFVHGFEALHWYQRIFSGTFANITLFKSFLRYIYSNTTELRKIRKFLKHMTFKCEFVTVSEWMREQAEKAWRCKGKLKWHIIPNYINAEYFAYSEKDNCNMLSIRPFSSGKYANDITAKFIRKLNNRVDSSMFRITWIGKGTLYERITNRVSDVPNLILENRMLQQQEIYEYHKQSGIFICPTRQDAQGVSMCEAMSSGLVPITLYNTAIPEYLPDISEIKCRNVDDMVAFACKLFADEALYKRLSKLCSEFIGEKCGYRNTIQREIDLILS